MRTRVIALAALAAFSVLASGCSTQAGNTRIRMSALDVDLRSPEQINAAKPTVQQPQAQALPPSLWAVIIEKILSIKGRLRFINLEVDHGTAVQPSEPGYQDPDYGGHPVPAPVYPPDEHPAPQPPAEQPSPLPPGTLLPPGSARITSLRNQGPLVARSIHNDPGATQAARALVAPPDPQPAAR